MLNKLLTRDQFREQVFERDHFKCVICKNQAIDVHHLINRKLFKEPHEFGGYFLDNGASLCNDCHQLAESTTISVEELRNASKITNIILPDHFEQGVKYDTWGNEILSNGLRLKGELFEDKGCQESLSDGNVLGLFTNLIKYPKTSHLPWSEKVSNDDRVLKDLSSFENQEIIVSNKIDGEASTMYCDYLHARSITYSHHESRTWLKQFHASFAHEIPIGYRICGENVFARHTLSYNNLKSYFYVYSIWNNLNVCFSWPETLEYCELLGLTPVDVIYEGIFDIEKLKKLYKPEFNNDPVEGYVIRLKNSFHYNNFQKSVAKFVSNSFQMNDNPHWKSQIVIPNKLNKNEFL